jgi:hypothetical protein
MMLIGSRISGTGLVRVICPKNPKLPVLIISSRDSSLGDPSTDQHIDAVAVSAI